MQYVSSDLGPEALLMYIATYVEAVAIAQPGRRWCPCDLHHLVDPTVSDSLDHLTGPSRVHEWGSNEKNKC